MWKTDLAKLQYSVSFVLKNTYFNPRQIEDIVVFRFTIRNKIYTLGNPNAEYLCEADPLEITRFYKKLRIA